MSQYVFEHEGKQFSPDGMLRTSVDADRHNREIEAQELAYWQTKPDRWHCYVSEKQEISTWLGTPIGRIVARNTFRNNFGSRTTTIRVRGTNGCDYYGRFGSDWSQLCHLRKFK